MKKYIVYTLLFSFSLLLFSCNKEAENRWNVEIKTTEPVGVGGSIGSTVPPFPLTCTTGLAGIGWSEPK